MILIKTNLSFTFKFLSGIDACITFLNINIFITYTYYLKALKIYSNTLNNKIVIDEEI